MNNIIYKFAIYTIFIFAVLNPILAGFFEESLGLTYKAYLLVLYIASMLSIYHYKGNKLHNLLINPATCFLYYLILQSVITLLTAENTALGFFYELSAYILPSLFVLILSALTTSTVEYKIEPLINIVLFVAIVSLVIDGLGYADFFAGRYSDYLPERFGFKQLHGFMPWPNAMANLLLMFGLIQQIFKPKALAFRIGYFAIISTFTRSAIAAAFALFFITFDKSRLKMLPTKPSLAVGFFILVIITFLSFRSVKDSVDEFRRPDAVYRLQYVSASMKSMIDYPIFGVGLGRLSERSLWEKDNFKFQNKYGLDDSITSYRNGTVDMGGSDTSVTLLAEIGLVGLILFAFQFVWFVRIAIKTGNMEYLLIFIPLVMLFYSTAGVIFSFNVGVFYWFLFGKLVSKYFETVGDQWR